MGVSVYNSRLYRDVRLTAEVLREFDESGQSTRCAEEH